jgi:RNA polymerase sigma-70 factor (ECF subfamily)
MAMAGSLESALAGTRARGQAAWPDIEIADDVWRAFLGERIPAGAELPDAVDALHIEDLWIACACLARDDRALAAFDRAYRTTITLTTRRVAPAAVGGDDLVQLAYTKLFVGDAKPAAIASYLGRGSLAAWLRMIVVRMALDLRRADGNREAPSDDEIVAWPDPREDPEMTAIRQRYGAEFKAAFEGAMATLTPRERNVLRQQTVYQMTLDQIAGVHRVHRSAVARWLADARQALLIATREALADRIGANRAQVESLLTLLHSQLDVSIERLLASKS